MATTETASNDNDFNAERLLQALMDKHRVEIDRIIELKSEDQQEEIKKYGLNPQAIKNYYSDFLTENAKLRKESDDLDRKASWVGWGTVAAVFGGIALMSPKRFGGQAIGEGAAKKIEGGRFIKWVVATVTSIVAGFLGNFGATHLLGDNVEERSAILVRKARRALERELAIAIENTEQQAKGASSPEPLVAELASKPAIAPRQSFVAEAAKEKAVAQGAVAQL